MDLKFRIPTKKIEEIKSLINEALSLGTLKVRTVTRIVGKLISFYRSTGPVIRVMTRATYRLIAQAKT